MYERQRDLTFAQVVTRGLAQRVGVEIIEYIVLNLDSLSEKQCEASHDI